MNKEKALDGAFQQKTFYIDVGDLSPEQALKFVEKMREEYKKNRATDSGPLGKTMLHCHLDEVQDDI